MVWSSAGLAPIPPRPTMSVLLIALCALAAVPSTKALPLAVSSLPSASSPSGILLVIVSVLVALSLVVGFVFILKKFLKKVLKKKTKEEDDGNLTMKFEELSGDPPERPGPTADTRVAFHKFIKEWNERSLADREEFIIGMVEEFPILVTPPMAMDAIRGILQQETNTDILIRLLRFTIMLERHLFAWDQTAMDSVPEGNKTIPSQTHQRFQAFLVGQAEEILSKYGDYAEVGEDGQHGFMRFVAFVFGFVCKHRRILKLMKTTWDALHFRQKDASRAMVWGYRRWIEERHYRSRRSNWASNEYCVPIYETYYRLMQELRGTNPVPRPDEGSRAQHLLFALGCGYEADWAEGPLAYMSDEKNYPVTKLFYGVDYMWLMMGRDFVMNNAWQWMCKKRLSEHDRMCNRFGYDGKLYEHVVDTVMKYDQDFCIEGGQCLMSVAIKYSPEIAEKVDFGEQREWYEKMLRRKKPIGCGINAWLLKNDPRELPPYSSDPSSSIEYYNRVALQWEEGKRRPGPSPDSDK